VAITTKHVVSKTDCVTREIAGETIIVPIRGHVGDLEAIYTLNEVATRIWQLIDGQTNVGAIVEALCKEYHVSAEDATNDVVALFESLGEAGLIRPSPEGVG
jgi:hypothetical protein